MSSPSRLRISRLFRYPVKGVAAVPVESLELDEVGPVDDRRWMVATPDGDRFISQRDHPRLALVRAAPGRDGGVTLQAPGAGTVDVPEPPDDAPRLDVPIWGDRVEAAVASEEAARWLSEALGESVVLVRIPDTTVRSVDPEWTVDGFHDRVGFADDEPIHLIGEASVRDLDAQVPPGGPSIGVERFRPNVVIDGAEPWEEDRWRRVRMGDVELAVVRPRARCVVTTVDPATGEKGPEPLATLNRVRRADGHVWVGQTAVHRSTGTLRVGDEVVVLEDGPPRPGIGVAETILRDYQ